MQFLSSVTAANVCVVYGQSLIFSTSSYHSGRIYRRRWWLRGDRHRHQQTNNAVDVTGRAFFDGLRFPAGSISIATFDICHRKIG